MNIFKHIWLLVHLVLDIELNDRIVKELVW
jgi:hypothetical protein